MQSTLVYARGVEGCYGGTQGDNGVGCKDGEVLGCCYADARQDLLFWTHTCG